MEALFGVTASVGIMSQSEKATTTVIVQPVESLSIRSPGCAFLTALWQNSVRNSYMQRFLGDDVMRLIHWRDTLRIACFHLLLCDGLYVRHRSLANCRKRS